VTLPNVQRAQAWPGGSEGGVPAALGTYAHPCHPLGLRPRPRRFAIWARAACAVRALPDDRIVQSAKSVAQITKRGGRPELTGACGTRDLRPHLPPPRASPSPSPPRRSKRVAELNGSGLLIPAFSSHARRRGRKGWCGKRFAGRGCGESHNREGPDFRGRRPSLTGRRRRRQRWRRIG